MLTYNSKNEANENTEGTEEAPEKSQSQSVSFTGWGTEVAGIAGTAGAPLEKRQLLATALSLQFGTRTTTKKIMERLIHSTTFPFLHHRSLLSVFSRTYVWIDSLVYQRGYVIPNIVREEILYALFLLPLAFTNFRRTVSSDISATDATPDAWGACRARVPQSLARNIF